MELAAINKQDSSFEAKHGFEPFDFFFFWFGLKLNQIAEPNDSRNN